MSMGGIALHAFFMLYELICMNINLSSMRLKRNSLFKKTGKRTAMQNTTKSLYLQKTGVLAPAKDMLAKLTRGSSIFLLAISLLPLVLISEESFADAQLMVTPTRIVFDRNTRNAQVTLINTGDAAGTYRIGIVNKRMTVDGKFEDVKTAQADELFADKMIRYSPRQVVLEPGKSQIVRLSLRKPSGIKAGEYRSHIMFKAIPKNAGTNVNKAAASDKITINLTAIISISIPVIVRHGDTTGTVAFTSIKYQKAEKKDIKPTLLMEIERDGNRSIYGDLLAEFVQEGGASTILSQISGIAVYTPNKSRVLKLPLDIPANLDLRKGVIRVYYRSPADKGNKVLAQTQLKLP
jgi:P pilus assembly chaperone PapD